MALILLADYDPLVGAVVSGAMRAQGHRLSIATSGAEAVRALESGGHQLVIIDCSTPALPGIETLGLIRRSPRGRHIPVLMLSDRTGSRDEEVATRAGASDYLRKPFSLAQLQVRVELLLARAGGSRSAAPAAPVQSMVTTSLPIALREASAAIASPPCSSG